MPGKRYAATPINRMKLGQLAQVTARFYPEIVKRANQQCHIIRKEYGVGSREGFKRTYRKDKVFYNEMRTYLTCTDGKRAAYIRFFGPPDANTPCWVWCSCQYFTYNLEVALARRNSSAVKLSNGQLPRERNARMIPHLCKHLVLAARLALQQRDDLAAERIQAEAQAKSAATTQQQGMEQKARERKIPRDQFTRPSGGLVDIP